MKKALLYFFLTMTTANASESLLYLEAQGVAGYSSQKDDAVYQSGHKYDAMQRNSVGFDYVGKFSSEVREMGTVALQARLAYDDEEDSEELQVYNAYTKLKTAPGNFWVGHNRVAFGLPSYWDTHGHLLQPLSMQGFGFDRDWGVGFEKDTADGDVKVAFSSGSGMPLHTHGNGIVTARASKGVLNIDNYSLGLSVMAGEVLDTMGYKVLEHEPKDITLAGGDLAFNFNNIENKLEVDFGEKDSDPAFAAFYRVGFNFLEENRLKLESQVTYTEQEDNENYTLGGGVTYLINQDLTARFMYEHDHDMNDNRFVVQLYYYKFAL